ncbi:MAG: DUF5009 domain-containing protein [Prevotellaceae bacterium]|jgi:hypothetical protein|nr:DUF5009 domain-containing protein [Prevotellaceae bacterium]
MKEQLTLGRVAAVDVFRALTMFLMLFVNDIPGLRNIPAWLNHADMNEDLMGFADTIFPAFLFCMGMSVSFAIQNRYRKGDSTLQVVGHIFWRTVALVLMGLFSLNSGGVPDGLSHAWFLLLMVVGFFLLWGVYPRHPQGYYRYFVPVLKTVGLLLLAGLVLYKDMHGKPFHTGWWGILGLIGWTYAVCAVTYLFTRESLRKTLMVWAAFILLAVLNSSSLIPETYSLRAVLLPFVPGGWTHHALGMSGVLVSILMQRYAHRSWKKFVAILCALGLGMLLLAWAAHPFWIISKILATPSWLFFCLAAFFPLFGLFYWLTDVRKRAAWFDLIKPAGTATLTCYILSYAWYAVWELLGLHYPALLSAGVPGLLRSLCFSLLLVLLAGGLVKLHIKLKV